MPWCQKIEQIPNACAKRGAVFRKTLTSVRISRAQSALSSRISLGWKKAVNCDIHRRSFWNVHKNWRESRWRQEWGGVATKGKKTGIYRDGNLNPCTLDIKVLTKNWVFYNEIAKKHMLLMSKYRTGRWVLMDEKPPSRGGILRILEARTPNIFLLSFLVTRCRICSFALAED